MRICFPNGEHADVAFNEGEVSIGAAAGNKVVLAGEGVHPRHAVLRIEPQRGILLNVISAGASTHVNGRPVSEVALLRLGDVLGFGHVQALLKPDDDRSIDDKVPSGTAAVEHDASARAAASRVVIRGTSGAFHGRSKTLQDTVLIGRSAEASVRIDDPDFPDRAASLEVQGDRIFLRHLGGADPVVVNGVAVKDAVLHPGDQIALDVHRFVIEAPGLPQRGSISEPAPAPGAHIGDTQTMRAVKVEPPTPHPPVEPQRAEEPEGSMRMWWWLLLSAVVIGGGLAAFIWFGSPAG